MRYLYFLPQFRVLIFSALFCVVMYAAPVAAKLDGAIFTTTPLGDIVNENVRYQSKEEVFLDGGPGPNAPGRAAALPAGLYYFQVTDPSGKCLLSSELGSSNVNGGTCFADLKGKTKGKNANDFSADPLACRLFYFDGVGGVTYVNDFVTVTTTEKIKGKLTEVDVRIDCSHQLGSEYLDIDPSSMPDGETVQLFPYANTPNPGGVYKAWVSTVASVEAACENHGGVDNGATGEGCDGFFGFIPRFSKTDNFKADLAFPDPLYYQIGLRAFHDKNLNCLYDPSTGDELVANWDFGVTEPEPLDDIRGIYRTIAEPDSGDQVPITFSVSERADLLWLVDQLMWFAQGETIPLNTPFTHFTTFADLRKYAKLHENGDLLADFILPEACVSANRVTRDAAETSDQGFVPTDFVDVNGIEEDLPIMVVGFGSVGFANIEVCKSKDINMNGQHDSNEPYIANWPMTLVIPESVPLPDDITGEQLQTIRDIVEPKLKAAGVMPEDDTLSEVVDRKVTKLTGDDGCVNFYLLLPNVVEDEFNMDAPYYPYTPYQVMEKTEGLHPDWLATSQTSVKFLVESVLTYDQNTGLPLITGSIMDRDDEMSGNQFVFNNTCIPPAVDFDTKGYWHNPNGREEIESSANKEDIFNYINSLPPYSSPTAYSGLEPFEDVGDISEFLVDSNASAELYYHREQLAQQLLAFIFNVYFNLDGDFDALIMFDGEWTSAADIIGIAVDAWVDAPSNPQHAVAVQEVIDDYNNNNELDVIFSDYVCPNPF